MVVGHRSPDDQEPGARKLALLVADRGDLDSEAKLWRDVMAETSADELARRYRK